MRAAYRAEVIREAEKATGLLESGVLMQRAAAAVAHQALRLLRHHTGGSYGRRVLVLVGSGDNGRDGLFAAERLRARGVAVTSCSVAQPAELATAYAALAQTDLVIDAVLGLGGRGGLREPVAALAAEITARALPVLAVDLPSGLVADSAELLTSFVANTTVTFGALRLCHLEQPARSRCGEVIVADIGLNQVLAECPVALRQWEQSDLVQALPIPGAMSSKYTRGVVGIDTGSVQYRGAGVLSTMGAVYAGAGMVRFVGPDPESVRHHMPTVVVGEGQVQAWLVGSGWGDRGGSARLAQVLDSGLPAVLDADALHPGLPRLRPEIVITPHAGELARLVGWERHRVESAPREAVAVAVERFAATVLLKGATQYVHAPDFPITTALPGPAWTAQAGSGDVLAGIIAALLAAGVAAPAAALAGASLQGLAAQHCWGPTPAHHVAQALPEVIGALCDPARAI
ncbi:MAG: bifunctional ADP-dependent NAD(P)H-hydrate dehydratase/NAD(P)H-hydrate epimerase [Propionibacteriaceae bacterium]